MPNIRAAPSHCTGLPASVCPQAAFRQREDLAAERTRVRCKTLSPAPSSLPGADIPSPLLTGAGMCWIISVWLWEGMFSSNKTVPEDTQCNERFGLYWLS